MVLDYVYDQARQLLETIKQETREQGLLPLFEPVAPFNRSRLLLPLIVAGSLVSLVFLSGIAIGAFATMFVALLALYLLLSEVFGISFELNGLNAFQR